MGVFDRNAPRRVLEAVNLAPQVLLFVNRGRASETSRKSPSMWMTNTPVPLIETADRTRKKKKKKKKKNKRGQSWSN